MLRAATQVTRSPSTFHTLWLSCAYSIGRRKECVSGGGGGIEASDDPPFWEQFFLHFLYKVLGMRSVQ